ncbi:protein borderless [Bicyclus anynana]|uniref:Protein borderless n=1 Tax=Bicyclus anynana TaxID=110368 RepID=A0ABM3LK44_BICAN|nr:protein borderless [Bicyclus anynana]
MGAAWALWAACALWASGARALLPPGAERLRAGVGGYAVMNCLLDFPFGIEIPYHLQWDHDGEVIFSWYSGDAEPRVADRWAGRVRRVGGGAGGAGGVLGGGALNVSSVRETDAGLYRCRVSFPNRTPPARNNGTFYYLDVDGAGGNLIATPPTNVTVLEGEWAELQCAPASAAWRVQWLRGAEPAPAPAANGSLLLRAAAADRARYECRVSAPDGRAQSAAAHLDVQYAARVTHAPAERLLAHGRPASLDCHFSANPPLTNLRWEKDGFLFDPYNVPGVFYSRNGSLLFNRVDESHAGEYSCTPYNALGSAGASRGVRVRVLRPPALAAAPPPLLLARAGAAAVLPCAPRAQEPAPAVRWSRRDGRPLPAGARLSGGNLTFGAVAAEDRGVYVCRVSNDAAELRAESELLVEAAPARAPHALAAAPAPGGLRLRWAAGGAADAEHAVWYRERGAGEWRTQRVLTRGATHATLLGLRAGVEYELRVLAQDHVGDGLFSKPVFARAAGPALDEDAATEVATEAEEAEEEAGEATDAPDAPATDAAAPWGAEEPLEVSVRLVDEGALVLWRGAGAGAGCELRWYEDAAERRLLAVQRAPSDYALVRALEEGGRYWAAVRCAGAGGGAALAVPRYARLRTVALSSAGAALLLAALAGALLAARRRLRAGKRAR